MKTYRVSNVERFRQFEQDEDGDVAALLADIRGESEPSAAMRAGTALHKALELAGDGEVDALHCAPYEFSFLAPMALEIPRIREVRASKVYIVDGEPVRISGQVDGIEGKRIDDHKSTGRFDPERYIGGYQWRLYLDIFDADRFRWNVFEMDACEDDAYAYVVREMHRLEQWRYPRLEADCVALVERFTRFMRDIEVTA